MKKILTLLLALALAVSLFACGNTSSTSTPAPSPQPSQPSNTEDPSSSQGPEVSSDPDDGKSDDTSKPSYSIDNLVLVDDDNCTFAITSVKESSSSIDFNVYLENKTELNLMFSVDESAVNGYAEDPFWAEKVSGGKKSNSTISFSKSSLRDYGLLPIDEFQFKLKVYDDDDWGADSLVEDRFYVYPTGLSSEAVVYPDRIKTDNEQVVVDNEKGTFVILADDEDGFWGYTVLAYIDNKTDVPQMFAWEDVSVNGYMIDPFWAKSIPAHTAAYVEISFSGSDLEENNIEDVEEIEFRLQMYNDESWGDSYYVDEVFTYNP